ncbi:unnamed protein product, partial [Mesorhabditis spiculigera]
MDIDFTEEAPVASSSTSKAKSGLENFMPNGYNAKQSLEAKTASFRQALERCAMPGLDPGFPPDPEQSTFENLDLGYIEEPKERERRSFAEKYKKEIHDKTKDIVVQWYYDKMISKEEYKDIMRDIVKPCLKYRIRSRAEIRDRAQKILAEYRKKVR